MSKSFRPWRINETQLLPASVQNLVSKGHLARLVVSLVREQLSLTQISASYSGEKGQPPYHPAMMTALLLYSYCSGAYSSRRIAKACRERTDFLMIVALDPPNFRTVSEFRRRHSAALSGLFTQVLPLCEKAGLVKLGHVALDGTKIKANASKHKAMSYERMTRREKELAAEVARWLDAAEVADVAEDRAGKDKSADELPDWVADEATLLAKIREAKAAAEAKARAEAAAEEQRRAAGRKKPGKKTPPLSGVPDGKGATQLTRSREPHHEEQG
jgi:transposase